MPVARAHSIALVGVEGHPVLIEADIENGLPGLLLVGLPDTALREARDRIRAAIVNSHEQWPQRRITVGLSPASLPKRGSGFDIGIAVSILAAAGQVPPAAAEGIAFLGELGLDGQLRPVRGVLPAVVGALAAGLDTVVVADSNAAEAAIVPGVTVVSVPVLTALLAWLRGRGTCPPGEAAETAGVRVLRGGAPAPVQGGADPVQDGAAPVHGGAPAPVHGGAPAPVQLDLADVLGQPTARRAAEICAAGGHHLSMLGPPGAGKTMLAERIPTIMPPLTWTEALEVTSIHSVAGVLAAGTPLLTRAPFCTPHHTATKAAIIGGGSGTIRPGAASLAHCGCLFLDEAPEFARDVLDALRQPLESGAVVVARSGLTARFPARFILVLAANPCSCARAAGPRATCTCSPGARRRYLARLSGPLLDRVDLKVEFLPVGRAELLSDRKLAESSAVVAARVAVARERAAARLADTPWRLNAEVPGSELRRRFPPVAGALAPLARAMDLGEVSARGMDRIVRVAWTVADLEGVDRPGVDQISYALGLWLGVGRP